MREQGRFEEVYYKLIQDGGARKYTVRLEGPSGIWRLGQIRDICALAERHGVEYVDLSDGGSTIELLRISSRRPDDIRRTAEKLGFVAADVA